MRLLCGHWRREYRVLVRMLRVHVQCEWICCLILVGTVVVVAGTWLEECWVVRLWKNIEARKKRDEGKRQG